MFDKEIVIDSLQKIRAMLTLVIERASVVETPNDFLCSSEGMMRLDAIWVTQGQVRCHIQQN